MNHENCDMTPEEFAKFHVAGFGWRVAVSITSGFGWLAFLVLWLAFYAGSYDIYQNIAVVLLSIIGTVALNAAVWVSFGLKMAGEHCWKKKRRGADIVSAISGVGWVAFLIVWLLQYAGDFSIYQNLAVFIVSVLVLGGVNAAAHASSWAGGKCC